MLPRFAVILAGLALLFGMAQSARASVVVAFSAEQNVYGWCAGYAEEFAETCSQRQCASEGGTDCQLVVDCRGGWTAVALSADTKIVGIGAACDRATAYSVRVEALASCIVASHALCWTSLTLSSDGKTQAKDDNHDFDLVWYAQALLSMAGYKPGIADGNFGPASVQALSAFQNDLGRKPDGVPTDEIIDRLLNASGGISNFAAVVQHTIIAQRTAEGAANTYGYAAAPSKIASLSDELAAATPDQQRLAVATILAVHQGKCSVPAQAAAELSGTAGSGWNVTCAEGEYTLLINPDGSTIVTPGLSTAVDSSGASAQANASPQGHQQGQASAPTTQSAPPPTSAADAGASGASVMTFVNGAGLKTTCSPTASANSVCIAYVQGVIDAVETLAAMEGKPVSFCLPDGETSAPLAQVAGSYAASHPELQQTAAPTLILRALNETFPCKTH